MAASPRVRIANPGEKNDVAEKVEAALVPAHARTTMQAPCSRRLQRDNVDNQFLMPFAIRESRSALCLYYYPGDKVGARLPLVAVDETR